MLLELLDANGDGKVSYMEFTDLVTECDGGKTIDDPHHWAFYLFEDIRRKLARSDRSLAALFGVNERAWSQKGKDGGPERVTIPWATFLEALRGLPAGLHGSQEQELLELLDAVGPGGTVELQHFVALLGVEEDHTTVHAAHHKRRVDQLTKHRSAVGGYNTG